MIRLLDLIDRALREGSDAAAWISGRLYAGSVAVFGARSRLALRRSSPQDLDPIHGSLQWEGDLIERARTPEHRNYSPGRDYRQNGEP